jgi:hypothetical protein
MSGSGTPGYADWLKGLKVGDEVICDRLLYRITGETPKRWKVSRGPHVDRPIEKASGKMIGWGNSFSRVEPVTDNCRQLMRELNLKTWAASQCEPRVKRLSTDRIAQVKALVEKLAAEQLEEGAAKP